MTRRAALGWALAALAACAPRMPELPPAPPPPGLEALDQSVQRLFASLAERVETVRADAGSPSLRAAAYGELGAFHLANRFLPEAELCLRTAVALDPEADRWLAYLAGTLYRRGDLPAAVAVLERRAQNTSTLLAIAEASLRLGELQRARRALGAAQRLDADEPLIAFGRARLALASEAPQEALKLLERAEALGAAPGLTRESRARASRRLGAETAVARTLAGDGPSLSFRTAIERADPLWRDLARYRVGARRHDLRALAAQGQGQLELALVELRQAIATDPDRLFARLDTADLLLRLGRPEEARGELQTLLALRPEFPPAVGRLAEVEARLNHAAAAEDLFARALELDPLARSTLLAYGDFLAGDGRCSAARDAYTGLLALDPGSELATVGLARCDLAEEDSAAAAHRLEDLLGGRSDAARARLVLARLLALAPEMRDASRALELATAARGQLGEAPATFETLAMAHAAGGDFTAAVALQRRALAACSGEGCRRRAERRLAGYRLSRLPDAPLEAAEPLDSPATQLRDAL